MWPFKSEPVYCEDCKWHREYLVNPGSARCTHPANNEGRHMLVARQMSTSDYAACVNGRSRLWKCGPSGKLFVLKQMPAKTPTKDALERIAAALEKPMPIQVTVKMPEGEYR